jgi:hypothetical protein
MRFSSWQEQIGFVKRSWIGLGWMGNHEEWKAEEAPVCKTFQKGQRVVA